MDGQQLAKISSGNGFVAALDQSGGSTPNALRLYGIDDEVYSGNDEMLDLMHAMRTRIITSPSFDGFRILGAILFEDTLGREIQGRPSAEYLWRVKHVVPFLKVDRGLAAEVDGAQLMQPIPGLDALLARAASAGIFGTKMRSVIRTPGAGLDAVVAQQFQIGRQILAAGLVPILEPEIDIHSPLKAGAEEALKSALLTQLGGMPANQAVMLKLTLPETDNLYLELVRHPRVLRVLALSGGYGRAEADARLSRNNGVVASFSRALTEGLSAEQTDDEFNSTLEQSITSIAAASST
jgi:fructose-bisphosphate aldolase, class I